MTFVCGQPGCRHAQKGVGRVVVEAAKAARAAERRRIAAMLRIKARNGSRKHAGILRLVANMISEEER